MRIAKLYNKFKKDYSKLRINFR